MSNNVVSHADWIKARKELLEREKAFTRERDALSAARRALPMERVEKRYVFRERSGERTLADLFDGRSQLIIYHFMFDPAWEAGCRSCSYVADNFVGAIAHLAAYDTSFAAISRAPLEKIEGYRERMGWSFRWLSSHDSDFNYDFGVSFRAEDVEAGRAQYNYIERTRTGEAPGVSTFVREGDVIFHTYSSYGRGLDILIGAYNYLDLTAHGRNEKQAMERIRRRDEY